MGVDVNACLGPQESTTTPSKQCLAYSAYSNPLQKYDFCDNVAGKLSGSGTGTVVHRIDAKDEPIRSERSTAAETKEVLENLNLRETSSDSTRGGEPWPNSRSRESSGEILEHLGTRTVGDMGEESNIEKGLDSMYSIQGMVDLGGEEGELAKDEGEQQAGGVTVVGLTAREANKREPNLVFSLGRMEMMSEC